MRNSNFKPYIQEIENYLELHDLTLNKRRSYRSYLRSYFTWIPEPFVIRRRRSPTKNIRTYLLFLKKVSKLSNHTINGILRRSGSSDSSFLSRGGAILK